MDGRPPQAVRHRHSPDIATREQRSTDPPASGLCGERRAGQVVKAKPAQFGGVASIPKRLLSAFARCGGIHRRIPYWERRRRTRRRLDTRSGFACRWSLHGLGVCSSRADSAHERLRALATDAR